MTRWFYNCCLVLPGQTQIRAGPGSTGPPADSSRQIYAIARPLRPDLLGRVPKAFQRRVVAPEY